ncbi:MAG: thrombospondin type 3 repeat-containing protein [Flavobacteriales bacterium]|nr:thrombospondin type 3 repeat-containing protein [Flavobacteriales bacterium]
MDRYYRFTTSNCATSITVQLCDFFNAPPPMAMHLLDVTGAHLQLVTPSGSCLELIDYPIAPSSTFYLVIEAFADLGQLNFQLSVSQNNTDPDTDGDGFCDPTDNCPNTPGQIGSPCNDLDACTVNDVLNSGCICAGTFADGDADGICDLNDNCPGSGNAGQEDGDLDGIGDVCDQCPLAYGQEGSSCNDGNDCTINDVLDANCNCVGIDFDVDDDGVCDFTDNCTTTPNADQADSDGDFVGDACDICPGANGTVGWQCNDGDPCTVNDLIDAGCTCAGVPAPDSDGDGICDAIDPCPTVANPGVPCPATIYEVKQGIIATGATVRVHNALVTGKGEDGFFVQVKEDEPGYLSPYYSGLFVRTGLLSPLLTNANVGARVTIDGVITWTGWIELDNVTTVFVTDPGPIAPPVPIAVPYAQVITGDPYAFALEGVIVSLGSASVTATVGAIGEFTLTDATPYSLVVDDFLYAPNPTPTVGQVYASGVCAPGATR